jgi:hypothetical protein
MRKIIGLFLGPGSLLEARPGGKIPLKYMVATKNTLGNSNNFWL